MTTIFFIGCSNSKKTSQNSLQKGPDADIQLAPNHIQALLEITNIEETKSQKTVTARVLEILNYGSATDPLPSGTVIKFSINNNYSEEIRSKIQNNSKLNTVLFHQNQEMMMGESQNSTSWKLISINN